MESPVSKLKLLTVVPLCCSPQHTQLPPGQSTGSKLVPWWCFAVTAMPGATVPSDTAKSFAEPGRAAAGDKTPAW